MRILAWCALIDILAKWSNPWLWVFFLFSILHFFSTIYTRWIPCGLAWPGMQFHLTLMEEYSNAGFYSCFCIACNAAAFFWMENILIDSTFVKVSSIHWTSSESGECYPASYYFAFGFTLHTGEILADAWNQDFMHMLFSLVNTFRSYCEEANVWAQSEQQHMYMC